MGVEMVSKKVGWKAVQLDELWVAKKVVMLVDEMAEHLAAKRASTKVETTAGH